jgi:hypothetical protein
MALGLGHTSEVKFAAGGVLVPFRGRHLVEFINQNALSLAYRIYVYQLLLGNISNNRGLLSHIFLDINVIPLM